jgi:hypothetical protein
MHVRCHAVCREGNDDTRSSRLVTRTRYRTTDYSWSVWMPASLPRPLPRLPAPPRARDPPRASFSCAHHRIADTTSSRSRRSDNETKTALVVTSGGWMVSLRMVSTACCACAYLEGLYLALLLLEHLVLHLDLDVRALQLDQRVVLRERQRLRLTRARLLFEQYNARRQTRQMVPRRERRRERNATCTVSRAPR